MAIPKKLDSKVFALTDSELSKTGWRKRKPGIFTLDIGNQSIGWLGLNTAHYRGGRLEINPVIGVCHSGVEELVAESSGMKFHQYTSPSVSITIGYLMPKKKYAAWSFEEEGNNEALVAEIAVAVERFGRPFIEQNSTLAALYEALLNSKRGVPPDPLDYRIAVASLLLGKRTEAESFIDAKLREIGDRTDAAADWFRKFAAKLRER